MVFSSLPFLFLFLTVVLLVSHILPFRFRNFFLLLANLVFYAYGEPVYVLIMIGSILVNFFAGLLMDKQSTQGRRRAVLVVGIVLNLAALGVFKYAGLFVSTLREIPGLSSLPEVDIALPIGISFYTFQAVSYLIDVYWDDCAASHNLINFASYISLFPQLIAGPIVRYKDVNEQLVSRRETPTLFNSGVRLFVVGLAKKVLLANQFGMLWDAMSADPVAAGALGAWAGACAYTLQIYFDFAGYSDMARGLGRMLGFEFCINFNYPYISKSVTEFWRRWHISLSTWFRDYVYFPLGGSRVNSKAKHIRNLFVVWLLTGVWHGANWTFLAWGLFYFVLLVLEKYGGLGRGWPVWAKWLFTFLMVNFAWVLFRADSLAAAGQYLQAMFGLGAGGWDDLTALYLRENWTVLAASVLFAGPLAPRLRNWAAKKDSPLLDAGYAVLAAAVFLVSAAFLIKGTYNPFIYFNF